VTEFFTQNLNVPLGYFIPEKEKVRYIREYEDYKLKWEAYQREYARYQEALRNYATSTAILGGGVYIVHEPMAKKEAPSLEEIEEGLPRASQSAFVTVANIGLTVRVLNVTTGEIVWVGQASKRHLQLQEGLQILTRALVTRFRDDPVLGRPTAPPGVR